MAADIARGLTGAAPGTWPAVALAGSYELLMVITGAARRLQAYLAAINGAGGSIP